MNEKLMEGLDIRLSYPGGKGVFGVSLCINSGQLISLVGPNGCGKSSVIRVLAGLQVPESGSVSCFHKKESFAPQMTWGWFLGVVSQHTQPWPHLSVLENVSFALQKVKGLARSAALEKSFEALGRFDLKERAGNFPGNLSGGLKQRLVLARAFALDPQVLLLDEVTSALDPEWAHRVGEEMAFFCRNGGAVLQVSHRIGQVRNLSDRVVFMDQGKVLKEGAPSDVFSSNAPKLVQLFLETS